MMKLLMCLALFAATASARQVDRPCQPITIREGLDVVRYLGLWFELERFESPFQVGFECVTANYNLNPDGSVRVANEGLTPAGNFFQQIGRAVISFPDETPLRAQLNVSFFDMPNDRSNYWVLSTDYINYALVFSCEDLPNERSNESFWYLSRTTEYPTSSIITDRGLLYIL